MNDISKDKDYQEFLACTEVTFGTGEGLLGYGICARCKKQAPVVRGAFSGALGAQNRLLWYGSDIRYRKPPSLVRDAFSGAPGTRQPPVYGICARCKKQAPVVRDAFSGAPCAQIIICC